MQWYETDPTVCDNIPEQPSDQSKYNTAISDVSDIALTHDFFLPFFPCISRLCYARTKCFSAGEWCQYRAILMMTMSQSNHSNHSEPRHQQHHGAHWSPSTATLVPCISRFVQIQKPQKMNVHMQFARWKETKQTDLVGAVLWRKGMWTWFHQRCVDVTKNQTETKEYIFVLTALCSFKKLNV